MDPMYRGILYYLLDNETVTPDEIANLFGFTRQAADYRLKKLHEYKLIIKFYDDEGRVLYKLSKDAVQKLKLEKAKRVTKEEIYRTIKYLPLIPFAIGLIGLGNFVASGEIARGFVSFSGWIAVSFIVYVALARYFKR